MTSNSNSPDAEADARGGGQEGPPLLVPALSFAVLTIAVAVLGAGGPRDATSAADVLAYDASHATSMNVGAALLLGSAIPLVICAVTLQARLRRLGVVAAGPWMGVAGAILAAAALIASALFTWTATQTSGLGDPNLAAALTRLAFAAGSVGFVAPLGLLVAGIAVPALLLRLIPRALAWAGLVVAVLALLSTFAIITDVLYPLFPLGRFGGVLFLVAVAALLPRSRPTRPRQQA